MDIPRPPPPPRRLDHHSAAVPPEGDEELARRGESAFHPGPGEDRDAAAFREPPRPGLVAEQIEGLRGGADEGHAVFRASPGEVRVLAQEAVSGVDGVTARPLRRPDDRLPVEVGGCAPPRERHHLVRPRRVQGPHIVLGADRNHREPELRRAPRDADRDLPPVRNEDARESHVLSWPGRRAQPPIIDARAERKQPPRSTLV